MTILASNPSQTSVDSAIITPEQFLQMNDDGPLYELVGGQLVEKPMSDYTNLVSNLLCKHLDKWAEANNAGLALVEASYRCFPHDPNMIRRPDVSFISAGRLADYRWEHGFISIAPDLAAEIVSPRDEIYALDRKIDDYFQAGVQRVWILNPDRRSVRIHRAPGDLEERVGEAELTDEPLLPGFRLPLAKLFASVKRDLSIPDDSPQMGHR